ncbi:MAG: hypothetical protein QM699_12510 [Amaricoccus sp.]|uniref:hypothetical protein n=1 Tax=Amaricoccus sp. TaxID=1872485 RepID=UPI0039E5B5B0
MGSGAWRDSVEASRGGRRGAVWREVAGWIEARPVLVRWLLAGPGAILAGLATMAAMPLWVPAGSAGVNDVALPIILTPLLWAAPFFYAVLARDLVRAVVVLSAAIVVQATAVLISLA